jgi:hypothetical protein
MPQVLVSDRDPRFTGRFWQRLFERTGTRLNMSTARHPETDGQTERANRTLEEMLRAYVSPYQDDWDEHLLAVEFAYNSAEHASTKYSPFYLMFGQHPHVPLSFLTPAENPGHAQGADEVLERMAEDLERAKGNLRDAKERQTKQANKRRRDYTFAVGEKVLLSSGFLMGLPQGAKLGSARAKLGARGWGPFTVEELVSEVAVKLKLPAQWKIHPVVHVSNVIPWRDCDVYPNRIDPPPDPVVLDGEEFFHVEAVRDHEWRPGGLYYLVKWRGYPEEENTWEPAVRLLEDCEELPQLVERYRVARQLKKGFEQVAPPRVHMMCMIMHRLTRVG